ncbi:MAG: hypothetical protein ACLQVD_19160 [Capsulimonadaceae bacterium]
MKDRYFACRSCRCCIDAGSRFTYWTLEEPGVVVPGAPVDADAVLAYKNYWAGVEEADWLAVLLPRVREFLTIHRAHDLVYGESAQVGYAVDAFEWLEEIDYISLATPRWFVERLHFHDWAQVMEFVEQCGDQPWWWDMKDVYANARDTFERVAAK